MSYSITYTTIGMYSSQLDQVRVYELGGCSNVYLHNGLRDRSWREIFQGTKQEYQSYVDSFLGRAKDQNQAFKEAAIKELETLDKNDQNFPYWEKRAKENWKDADFGFSIGAAVAGKHTTATTWKIWRNRMLQAIRGNCFDLNNVELDNFLRFDKKGVYGIDPFSYAKDLKRIKNALGMVKPPQPKKEKPYAIKYLPSQAFILKSTKTSLKLNNTFWMPFVSENAAELYIQKILTKFGSQVNRNQFQIVEKKN